MVDSVQLDRNMKPLTSFLYKCTFSAKPGDRMLTVDVLKKLNYSVFSFSVPKMKEENGKTISYGSFALPFPYYSSSEKEMSIEFYEQDDMLISKVFYELMNRDRWRATPFFRFSDAWLLATLEVYDQRNSLNENKNVIFRRQYALKVKTIDPPKFSRSSDAMPTTVTIRFNTIQSEYKSERLSEAELEGFTNEMKTLDKAPDPAIVNTEDAGNALATFVSFLGIENSVDQADQVSKNETLREFSESLGPNSLKRTEAFLGKEGQKNVDELRAVLKDQGVNTKDYSEVYGALTEMGIMKAGGNSYCQLGVSLVESIVTEKDRVIASTASMSIPAWKEEGYQEVESKKLKKQNAQGVSEYINSLIKSGKVKEGDKVVIDYSEDIKYDKEKKNAGHIVTILYDENRIAKGQSPWYTGSDFEQTTLAGIGKRPAVKVHLLKKKSDTE